MLLWRWMLLVQCGDGDAYLGLIGRLAREAYLGLVGRWDRLCQVALGLKGHVGGIGLVGSWLVCCWSLWLPDVLPAEVEAFNEWKEDKHDVQWKI